MFSGILSETFSDLNYTSKFKFDEEFFAGVSQSLKNSVFSKGGFIPVSIRELIKAFKRLKINSSPGDDDIQNIPEKSTIRICTKNALALNQLSVL